MKNTIIINTLLCIITLLIVGMAPNASFVDERDGQTYNYTQIGKLYWLTHNLNYETPSSECYDSQASNCETYGRLYPYEDAQTACPKGWRLPTKKEWKSLRKVMRSKKADKIILPNTWKDPRFAGATNELGLNIVPGGRKDDSGLVSRPSPFAEKGIASSYWLKDPQYHWHIRWGKSHIHKHGDISKQKQKFYIRCVCDTSPQ